MLYPEFSDPSTFIRAYGVIHLLSGRFPARVNVAIGALGDSAIDCMLYAQQPVPNGRAAACKQSVFSSPLLYVVFSCFSAIQLKPSHQGLKQKLVCCNLSITWCSPFQVFKVM